MSLKIAPQAFSLRIFRASTLSSPAWLVHGFSTRTGGRSDICGTRALNLGFTKHDSKTAVEHNRAMFLKALSVAAGKWEFVTLRQVHSDLIHCITSAGQHPTGDGVITQFPRVLLGVQTADCVPVLLADPKHKAIGAFHAGWRGTLKRIVEKGVGEMRKHFGTKAGDLRAAIGPAIHSCCYEVGEEVRDKFRSQFGYADELFCEVRESDPVKEKYPLLFLTARAPGHGPDEPKLFLDLLAANRHQLTDAGVEASNVWASDLCTFCSPDLLFSYRREGVKTGRQMGVIGIR